MDTGYSIGPDSETGSGEETKRDKVSDSFDNCSCSVPGHISKTNLLKLLLSFFF